VRSVGPTELLNDVDRTYSNVFTANSRGHSWEQQFANLRRRVVDRSLMTNRQSVTQHPRRGVLSLAVGAMALPALLGIAWGQTYPLRPVRLIVGFAAGGSNDVVARLMGQALSERLGQQVVIENRPGGVTNIATEAVVNAPPDGHTLLLVSTAAAINATLYERLNFNFIRDIAPVAGIMRVPNVMEVNPSVPAKTVPEFIAFAKAVAGRISMASGGTGSSSHLAGELFKLMAGINMVHVPYRGGAQPLTDLVGGQVQIMFDVMPSSIEYIRGGKLRALAVTTKTRSAALPEAPSVGEFVPGYDVSTWYGFGVPKNTPASIIDALNKATNAVLADPRIKSRLADLGGTPLPLSPAEFGKLIVDETEKWGKVIRAANIKPD
jgi:tripartite-type tricarboxylate transporter receptor subunit TctC